MNRLEMAMSAAFPLLHRRRCLAAVVSPPSSRHRRLVVVVSRPSSHGLYRVAFGRPAHLACEKTIVLDCREKTPIVAKKRLFSCECYVKAKIKVTIVLICMPNIYPQAQTSLIRYIPQETGLQPLRPGLDSRRPACNFLIRLFRGKPACNLFDPAFHS